MRRTAVFLVLLGLCLATFGSGPSCADPASEKAAIEVAQSWLRLVDAGKYADSYKQTSSLMHAAVTASQWDRSLKAAREPLGSLVSRKLMKATFTTSVPGGPDGRYVVVQFATEFSGKKKAVETVTPMLDKDGKWRVSGYYIK